MRADIIIPTWNNSSYTCKCLESIKRHTCYPYRIIWVDNGSDLENIENVSQKIDGLKIKVRRVMLNKNYGFTRGINEGIKASDAPYLVFLNNDVEVTDSWLLKMIWVFGQDERIGVVGPVTNRIGNRQQADRVAASIGLKLGDDPANDFNNLRPSFRILPKNITFFCAVLKKAMVDKIGLLDEEMVMVGSDNDYNERARWMGFKCAICLNCFVYHEHHATLKNVKGLYAIRQRTKRRLNENRLRRRR